MIEILLSDHRGIYIPRDFVECCDTKLWHVKPQDVRQLRKGPEYEHYWQVWDDVLRYAFFVDKDGKKWRLYQDGDLFAICDDITDEQRESLLC